jgi:hypothetical protein
MSLISAGSISLDSTFKQNFYSLNRKKVGGAERAVEYEKLLVQWIEEKFYQIQVILSLYCAILQVPCLFMEIPTSKFQNSTSSKFKHFIRKRGTDMNKYKIESSVKRK